MLQPAFQPRGRFLAAVHERARRQLANLPLQGDPRLLRKAAVIAAWFGLSYALMLASGPLWVQVGFAVSYALAAAAVGFNVLHDAGHGTFSVRPRVNLWISVLCCIALGPSRHLWIQRHNAHHRFTNIHGWDDDVELRGWARLAPDAPWKPGYRGQQHYIFALYAVGTLEWFFVKDFVQYATRRLNHHQVIAPLSAGQRLEFWACKGLHLACFVALPFLLLPAGHALVLLAVFHLTLGVAGGLVFNIAHVVAEVSFPRPTEGRAIAEEWAAHQLCTTSNFANGRLFWDWFTGGLNRQIEHHLFPGICHTHLAALADVVRQTAAEFDLPYVSFRRYRDALASHRRLLRQLGASPCPVDAQALAVASRA